jgi:hypothetical protein
VPEDLRAAKLRARGWIPPRDKYDICFLDCPHEGWTLKLDSAEITLCLDDAMVLENGAWRGDYGGAPLPPTSAAVVWPWRPLEQAVAS